MFNEKARKVELALVDKLEELTKKHGVKMIGCWIVPTEHLIVEVYEAPSFEAFQKLGMEPEIMAWYGFNTTEIKPAINFEEAMKMLKQAK